MQLISSNPQINATITEFDINKIKEGDEVDVTVNSTGKKEKANPKIDELPTSYDTSDDSAASSAQSEHKVIVKKELK